MEIRLSNGRYEEIKRRITNLFVQYGISCVPISGFEIAKKLGVPAIPYSAFPRGKRELLLISSEDGLSIKKDSGQWLIYYNDEKDYGRVNNTIMHEIGHIVLDHSESSELAEKEVKFFAKYALVPPVLVHKLGITEPQRIADVFGVSCEAACYALNYYRKWLRYGDDEYTDYELQLLRQFGEAA